MPSREIKHQELPRKGRARLERHAKWRAGELAPTTKDAALDKLWGEGVLWWKLHPTQLAMYEAFGACPNTKFVINCSRRLGKSYMLCLLAIEKCLSKPLAQVRYAAPTAKQVKTIIVPLMRELLKDCPRKYQPKWRQQDGVYEFPNGSCIYIAGCSEGNVESLRGVAADLAIIDEAGSIDDLKYAVSSVLMPQLLTTRGRLIMASTPPVTPSHDFAHYCQEAEVEGSYIHRTIYDNPLLDEVAINSAIHECGGRHTTEFRREYLAEFVTETTRAVVPEFTAELEAAVVTACVPPSHYDRYVAMDPGFKDLTVVLFGYWDFTAAKLVIQRDLALRGATTQELAVPIKATEEALWGAIPPYRRVSDAEPRLLQDFFTLHQLHFTTTAKDDREAALNEVRVMLAAQKILIDPSCTTLRAHLRHAVWNKTRTNFDRSADHGHFDAVAALMYMVRNLVRNRNPFPAEAPPDPKSMFGMRAPSGASPRFIHQLFAKKGTHGRP